MSHIHVIAHTHWDQEWYFTLQDSNIPASRNFADVIDTLERYADYTCYHFDGQTAVVEDFLAVNPQYADRLKLLVKTSGFTSARGTPRRIRSTFTANRLSAT